MESVMLVIWEMDNIPELLPCWHLKAACILFMEPNQKPFPLSLCCVWCFFFLFVFFWPSMCNSSSWKLEMAVEQLNIPFILFIKEIQSLKRWSNWLTGMTVKPTKFNLILSSTTYRAYKLSPCTRQACSLHLIQMEMKASVIVLSDFTISINPA